MRRGEPRWETFDEAALARTLAALERPGAAARFLPEDESSGEIDETLGELLGLHPSLATVRERLAGAMRSLAGRGHVVFIGRG